MKNPRQVQSPPLVSSLVRARSPSFPPFRISRVFLPSIQLIRPQFPLKSSSALVFGTTIVEAMGYDAAMVDASAPAVSARDVGKKKKSTRTAKLKQCKLDARREQWLSQVKNKCCKVAGDHVSASPSSPSAIGLLNGGNGDGCRKDKNPNGRPKQEEDSGESFGNGDLASPINSPTSSYSGTNSKSGHSHSSSSTTYSASLNEAEEEEEHFGEGEGSLDDWEAVADAIMTTDDAQRESKSCAVPSQSTSTHHLQSEHVILKNPEPMHPNRMAWRPDDAFRPQSLPSLSKHLSFPSTRDRRSSHGNIPWRNETLLDQHLSCPVCFEDLDNTDSSFLPCSCGFRLCLFCHKRILETDGRCPGCRKLYCSAVTGESFMPGGVSQLTLQLSRSCSMSASS